MNILYLGNENAVIIEFLRKNNNVIVTRDILTENILDNIDFIISFGYRYIIPSEVVNKFKNKAINLHISYLPWNKGADPNLWSFLEDTPKGVSIHYIDEKLDTGDILAQKTIQYSKTDTLKSTYNKLISTIEKLFVDVWESIIKKTIIPVKQEKKGSYHYLKNKEPYLYLLTNAWDTEVEKIIGRAKRGNDEDA